MTETAIEQTSHEPVRWLCDVYMQIQKVRVGLANRQAAYQRGADNHAPDRVISEVLEKLEGAEERLQQEMQDVLYEHPAWDWLSQVKGAGPTLSTKILGLIGDISRFDTVSKLWKYAGYGLLPRYPAYDPDSLYGPGARFSGAHGVAYEVVEVLESPAPERSIYDWPRNEGDEFENGQYRLRCIGTQTEIQRPRKGQKLDYNARLKSALYLLGTSFLRLNSPYRRIYDEAKEYYRNVKQVQPVLHCLGPDTVLPDRTTPEGRAQWAALIKQANEKAGASRLGEVVWTDGHVDLAARRKMIKVFLANLWEEWRKAEGLPVRPPYVVEHLGHTTVYRPHEFV